MSKKDAVFADTPPTNTPGALTKPLTGDSPVQALVPMAEPKGGWPADEFTGHGGSYVRDPFTGVRRRAEPEAAVTPPAKPL